MVRHAEAISQASPVGIFHRDLAMLATHAACYRSLHRCCSSRMRSEASFGRFRATGLLTHVHRPASDRHDRDEDAFWDVWGPKLTPEDAEVAKSSLEKIEWRAVCEQVPPSSSHTPLHTSPLEAHQTNHSLTSLPRLLQAGRFAATALGRRRALLWATQVPGNRRESEARIAETAAAVALGSRYGLDLEFGGINTLEAREF